MTATNDGQDSQLAARGNPFLDQNRVREEFYSDNARLISRSGSLKRAKVAGRDVPQAIVALARRHLSWSASGASQRRRILDVGCGRGTSSLALSAAFPDAQTIMFDLSQGLLATGRRRSQASGLEAEAVQGDFHQMPLPGNSCDLITAAFCLYHSRTPATVLTEFARCLRTDRQSGVIVVTKSVDSYWELDELVAEAGLDEHARDRPSLYESAHSGNIASLVGSVLTVQQVAHEPHAFRFESLAHMAQYVATVPKYQFPSDLDRDVDRITAALRDSLPDRPVTTTSTVTYVVAAQSVSVRRTRSDG